MLGWLIASIFCFACVVISLEWYSSCKFKNELLEENRVLRNRLYKYTYKEGRNDFIRFLLHSPSARELENRLKNTIAHGYHIALPRLSLAQLKNEFEII